MKHDCWLIFCFRVFLWQCMNMWLFVCSVKGIYPNTDDALKLLKLYLPTCGDHFAKIIEPLIYCSYEVVSAAVINDRALMHSSPRVRPLCARSLLTKELKVNTLCFHFVWSPENQNSLTIWCLDLDDVKKSPVSRHFQCAYQWVQSSSWCLRAQSSCSFNLTDCQILSLWKTSNFLSH